MRSLMLTLGLAFFAFAEAAPDLVELTNGKKLEGRVVYEDEEVLVLKVKTREKEYAKEDVASVRALIRELPTALKEITALDPNSVSAHHELAKELVDRNLPDEARLLHWKVLTLNPEDTTSNEALGHRKRGKSWTLPHRGRWYRFAERVKQLEDWDGAWEFETSHFSVRTNQNLSQAVEIALLLEQTYLGFYELFGPELALRDVTEKINAWVHADASSFPEALGGGRSYYSGSDRRLSVNASRGLDTRTVVHEAVHAITDASTRETGTGRGEFPGWLDEGLAEYMGQALVVSGRSFRFQPETPSRDHCSAHASAKKPYKLNRVLNFQSGDFGGTSKTGQKYAQSYTLVHFLMHGENGTHRHNFFEFLRSVYEGKASSTHFKKCLRLKKSNLEEAWHDHARNGA